MCIVFVGVFGYFKASKTPPAETPVTTTATSTTQTVEQASRYQIFSPEVFADTADTKRVLFFYANWCPTCIPVDVELMENADSIPPDVTIIRVNYNDSETDQIEKDLATQYGITYQHTFVLIDGNGAEINTWNGGNLDSILKNNE